jgi:hypothetical protein
VPDKRIDLDKTNILFSVSEKIMKPFVSIFCFFILSLSSCSLHDKELQLQQKEKELNQKEQQLLIREKDLQLREDKLQQLIQADSLKKDSVFLNPGLTGSWTVKMICTETTCAGSAIGDTKTETWEISYVDSKVVANALSGDQITRIYSGKFTGRTLELVDSIQATPTRMIVTLSLTSEDRMEGKREIIRENCRIIYSLELSKN